MDLSGDSKELDIDVGFNVCLCLMLNGCEQDYDDYFAAEST